MTTSAVSSPVDAVRNRLQRQGRSRLTWTFQALATDVVCPRAECMLSSADHRWLMDASHSL